jgi:hypothetical protein
MRVSVYLLRDRESGVDRDRVPVDVHVAPRLGDGAARLRCFWPCLATGGPEAVPEPPVAARACRQEGYIPEGFISWW